MRMKYFVISSVFMLGILACMTGTTVAPTLETPSAGYAAPSTAEVLLDPLPVPTTTKAGQVGEVWHVCGTLNVRAQPGAWGGVLERLKNQDVTALEWRDGWARIGEGRWVNGDYLCKAAQ